MSHLSKLQTRLHDLGYDGFIVPSADEYLSEFAEPFARRLRWATGFRGSTGVAIVLQNRAGLFLDGRYQLQGKADIGGEAIEVFDAAESTRHKWMREHLKNGAILAVDTRLLPYPEVERIRQWGAGNRISVVSIAWNPVDELWTDHRPPAMHSTIVDFPVHFAGQPAEEKCDLVRASLASAGMDAYLVTDPEDVAWLLNVRTHDSANRSSTDWHVLPIPLTRAIVEKTGAVLWFVDRSRVEPGLAKRLAGIAELMPPEDFEVILQNRSTGRTIGANLRKTPHQFGKVVEKAGVLMDSALLAHRRWKKNVQEVERAREGHLRDGKAVIRFMAWLQRAVREHRVTEMMAAQRLEELRREEPAYMGPSMPAMSASGPNGAIAHYVPSQTTDRSLNSHPIYWMDSGGQYYGCSTDNTLCMAVGEPEARHVHAHTLVLKGFIALARARFPVGTLSSQLDSLARQYLWSEGLDYSHGTGHGVGNFMNIHEGPFISNRPVHPLIAPIQAGMIVSNEPGYYVGGDFGIRLESHLTVVPSKFSGFLEFETISRLPIDPRLVDETLLTQDERQWLAHYHADLAKAYEGSFDEETAGWLHGLIDKFLTLDEIETA